MKKFLMMVLVLLVFESMACMADDCPVIYDTNDVYIRCVDARIENAALISDKPLLALDIEIKNNSKTEKIIQCKGAWINKEKKSASQITAYSWMNVGANAMKRDTIYVKIEEAGMKTLNRVKTLTLEMSSMEMNPEENYHEVIAEGTIKAKWLKKQVRINKEKMAEENRWQNH